MATQNVFILHIFIFCSVLLTAARSAEPGLEAEVEALKAFKNAIKHDPSGVLAGWSEANHHCNWTGVACDESSNQVIAISLGGMELRGEISPFLGNLSGLQVLDLTSNSFEGRIPPQLGLCSQLVKLVLYDNSFSGRIPVELGDLRKLQTLDLGGNYCWNSGVEFWKIERTATVQKRTQTCTVAIKFWEWLNFQNLMNIFQKRENKELQPLGSFKRT